MFACPDPHRPFTNRPWAFDSLGDSDWDDPDDWSNVDDSPHDLLDELIWWLDQEPLRFLEFVCSAVMLCPIERCAFVATVDPTSPREMRAIATAAQWLANDDLVVVMGRDLPSWLAGNLDEVEVTGLRRRRDPGTGATSYLLEVRLGGGEIGCLDISVGAAGDGAITRAVATDLTIERIEEIVAASAAGASGRYRNISAATAHRELVAALGRYHAAPFAIDPAQPYATDPSNPWPRIEPLVALALRWVGHAAGARRQGTL